MRTLLADFGLNRLVIDTIEPLDPKRKCCRMIGGILVERTVGDVLPVIKANQVGVGNHERGIESKTLTNFTVGRFGQ